ncbi:amidase family protein [Sphingobium sp. V4]|uniref:amidase family protein n=1 Tax=Sphingobium sp. V4 TaxID=3038927 RepID=UPI002557EBE2|nr:amidase family protein [Sphingobium sp. V4]WIW89477.1 amidase family protein [Sphingobium sp. V4]
MMLDHGRDLSAMDLVAAMNHADVLSGIIDACFEQVDVLLLPVLPFITPKVGELEKRGSGRLSESGTFTLPINISGCPAIALPGGLDSRGLPVGFQLVARRFNEATLIAIGHTVQRVTNWHLHTPALR